ncbi:MAG: hypothetical protein U5O15_02020 [Candidatus Krumholzibacteriota bacterium]|nr:hypothetical protein [Candidatus Krumholzibacteriota bacterium]
MFLTEEKVLKRVYQDISRGDLERALRNALKGHEKWPGNFDISMELIQLRVDLADFQKAAKLLKSTSRNNPGKKKEILQFSQEIFYQTANPFIGSFVLESLIRGKNLERANDFLGTASEEYLADLTARSKTKSSGFIKRGMTNSAKFTDNEILLGLLHIQKREFEPALSYMLNALENSPEHVETIGKIILSIKSELHESSLLEYILGFASMLLDHPDKAEKRFFKSAALANPPLEKILDIICDSEKKSENHLLLKGEVLIRLGKENEGTGSIKKYLAYEEERRQKRDEKDRIDQSLPGRINKEEFVIDRLTNLLIDNDLPGTTFLLCDVLSDIKNYKEAVARLEKLAETTGNNNSEITSRIEKNEDLFKTAPAQRLLAILYTDTENYRKAQSAYNMACEMDPTLIPELIDYVQTHIEQKGGTKLPLMILTELYAMSKNSEKANEFLQKLKELDSVDEAEVFEITAKVIKNCGATIGNLLSSIEICMADNDISGSIPYLIEFCEANPDKHSEFASRLKDLAGDRKENWSFVSELIDAVKEENDLSKPFQLLQAHSQLHSGKIEKAVFSYDQLMISDEDIKLDVIGEYEKVLNDNIDNTTLLLALYQLHSDEGRLVQAAHFLGKALESDPSQIRDVMSSFDKILENEHDNTAVWEELLRSSLAINHTGLAQEILTRALSALDRNEASQLYTYGAIISRKNNDLDESLRCLSMALTSEKPDLISIEKELNEIIKINPDNPEAIYLKGETYLQLGDEDKAAANFKRCVELSPEHRGIISKKLDNAISVSAKPWLLNKLLGLIAWKQDRREEALALLSKAQKGTEESVKELGEELEKLLSEAGGNSKLRKLYAENLRLENKFPESAKEIEILLSENNSSASEAISFLTLITEEEPLQFDANRLLTELFLNNGETGKSLTSAVNMLSSDEADPVRIEESAERFFETHKENGEFLIGCARIKALADKENSALDLYRDALGIDEKSCKRILAELSNHRWPETLAAKMERLRTDCLLSDGDYEKAFESLQNLTGIKDFKSDEIISRINTLIEKQQKPEYFSLALKLYAEKQSFDEACDLIKSKAEALSGEEIIKLKIELAGLAAIGNFKKLSLKLFSEVVKECDDRKDILKQIEKTIISITDEELSKGISKAENGTIGEEEAVRVVNTALDRERPADALKVLKKSNMSRDVRLYLTGKTYLAAERPVMAVALLSSLTKENSLPSVKKAQTLYLLGKASEILHDHGRASSSFMKIIEIHGEYLDAGKRAEENYIRFIDSEICRNTMVIEKTGSLLNTL